jgi:hypothetical protein
MLPRTDAVATPAGSWVSRNAVGVPAYAYRLTHRVVGTSRYGGDVSFAQHGPPASAKQIAYIQSLMAKAGYDDFRSARTEYRLTPRQARGKFTKSEASAMIDRLTSTDDDNPTVSAVEEPDTLDSAQALLIRGFKADVLADELRRRGWTVGEPA